uniref:Uncharacterized protein n=1 Tax=Heterorhabditis bacteriophora TaxID=37862 RepID=A0A1I7WJN5_HETBA
MTNSKLRTSNECKIPLSEV